MGRWPRSKDSVKMARSNGDSNVEIKKKNSAGNMFGPGDFPLCIAMIAPVILDSVRGCSMFKSLITLHCLCCTLSFLCSCVRKLFLGFKIFY